MSTTERPAAQSHYEDLTLHRLLVAVDGSDSSELALAAAITTAHRDNAIITLLTVVPDVVEQAARWTTAGLAPDQVQKDADEDAARRLREVLDRVPSDVTVRTVVRRGKAGQEIVAEATEREYDGIVVGARGVGRVGALMGSVSQHVMHHAPVPVFVAHAPRPQG